MSGDGLDLLIHRHLDGSLGEEEAKALGDRLRSDPAARRRLAEMAYDHSQLKELLEPAREVAAPGWSKGHLLAAACILLAVGVALVVGPWSREETSTSPAKPPPERREEGRVRVFARVQDRRDKTRVMLKVGEILKGIEPSEPLVGQVIGVALPRLKEGDRESGERDVAAYLMKLQTGQEVVLDLQRLDGADYGVASLTEEQVEWARRRDERKPPKEGAPKGPPEQPKKDGREDR